MTTTDTGLTSEFSAETTGLGDLQNSWGSTMAKVDIAYTKFSMDPSGAVSDFAGYFSKAEEPEVAQEHNVTSTPSTFEI